MPPLGRAPPPPPRATPPVGAARRGSPGNPGTLRASLGTGFPPRTAKGLTALPGGFAGGFGRVPA
eukprot:9498679-Pyramimonas_sp.AAC.1